MVWDYHTIGSDFLPFEYQNELMQIKSPKSGFFCGL